MNLIRDQFEHIHEGLHWQRWCRSPEQIGAWHYCCLNSIELMNDDVVTFGPSKPPRLADSRQPQTLISLSQFRRSDLGSDQFDRQETHGHTSRTVILYERRRRGMVRIRIRDPAS